MKVKSESEVAQSCPTPSDPMGCSLTGSSVHGIFQARVLEWGAIAFSVTININNINIILREVPLNFSDYFYTQGIVLNTMEDSDFFFLYCIVSTITNF